MKKLSSKNIQLTPLKKEKNFFLNTNFQPQSCWKINLKENFLLN